MTFGIKKLLGLVGTGQDEARAPEVSEIVAWTPLSAAFNRSVSETLPMAHLSMARVTVEGKDSYVVLPLGGATEDAVRREIGEAGGDAGRIIPDGPGGYGDLAPVAVNRHEVIVDILRDRGVVGDEVEVAPETADAVRGRDVFGVLPLSLASEARSVTTASVLPLPSDAIFPWSDERARERAGAVGRYMAIRLGSQAESDFMASLGGGPIVDLFARARERALGGWMRLR